VDPFDPPPHARHELDSRGEVFVWQARPGLVVERCTGVLTLPLALCISDFLGPLLVPGTKWLLFGDFERLTHYTREAREYLSAFSLERLATLDAIHCLISSKFVALGLSVFRDEVGGELVRVYSDRTSFLRSFAGAAQAST
jgi:hypothetical protein